MAKKITAQVKLQIPAGKATPAPPVGTALGPQGVNIMDFCKAFNAKTSGKDQEGLIIPVVITIFSDRSFTFITKTPPVPVLIKRACNLAKGSAEPHKTKVGQITQAQIEEIAKIKMPDLNCFELEAVQVGHLDFGDLFDLSLGDLTDLRLMRFGRSLRQIARALDQHRHRRRLGDECERTVRKNRDHHGDDQTFLVLARRL